jgi:hypothetical protein
VEICLLLKRGSVVVKSFIHSLLKEVSVLHAYST